jgi:hypothetical protein
LLFTFIPFDAIMEKKNLEFWSNKKL